MRAIPSPVESTVPVSRTSIRLSKSLICCFNISLISDARISITDLASSRCSPDRPSFLARKRSPQTLELRSYAAVEHAALELHDCAAEKVWDHGGLGDDALAGLTLENPVDAG